MATDTPETQHYTAFAGTTRIASGTLHEVASVAWQYVEQGGTDPLVVFDDTTSKATDINLSGRLEQVLARLPLESAEAPERRLGPGRPKLGVVSREVSLLPRHWEWLASQPGGASVALRKLVETARKENRGKDHVRRCRDAAHNFMWAMAGDLEGFEEASRALFASDFARLDELVRVWPADVRDHARELIARLAAAERAAQGHGGGSPADSAD